MHDPTTPSRRGLFATLLAALAWLFGPRHAPTVQPATPTPPASGSPGTGGVAYSTYYAPDEDPSPYDRGGTTSVTYYSYDGTGRTVGWDYDPARGCWHIREFCNGRLVCASWSPQPPAFG